MRTRIVKASTLRPGDLLIPDPTSDAFVVLADVDRSDYSTVIVATFVLDGAICDTTLQSSDLVHVVSGLGS